ncbi:MAG: sensor histidine kinase [Lachnospiraceae bacterium]
MLSSFYLFLILISLFELKILNLLLYFVFNSIFLFTQYKLKSYLAIFHSAVIGAVMAMCELATYNIIQRFTPHFFAKVNDFYHMAVFVIFSKIGFFSIICILMYMLKKQQKYDQQNDKSVFWLVFIPLATMYIMYVFIMIGDTYDLSPFLNWLVTFGAVFLLVSSLLVFGINQYNQRKNQAFMEMQLLVQKESDLAEYYKMLQIQYENQRILIHDIKKHLQSIDLLNQQKEQDKITAYIHQLLLSSDLKEASHLCEHELLNSILCRYMYQCRDKHISFYTDIRSGTTNFIADNDLTSLFCNLLDNALEAAIHLPDSFIELTTSKRENTPFIIITLINSCRKNPFFNQSGLLMTNKADKHKHGFGMRSVRKTIKKYKGDIQTYYNDTTLTFHTIITLKTQETMG